MNVKLCVMCNVDFSMLFFLKRNGYKTENNSKTVMISFKRKFSWVINCLLVKDSFATKLQEGNKFITNG